MATNMTKSSFNPLRFRLTKPIAASALGSILIRTGFLCGLVCVVASTVVSKACAGEPAERFVEQLREEAMFDWAAKYIDIYGKAGWLPEKFKKDAPLERLMILQDSLSTVRTIAQRDSIL